MPGNPCLVATESGEVVGIVRASAEPYRRTRHFADIGSPRVDAHGFIVEGRYPGDIKFGDGGYADTVAMGLVVKERVAGTPA